MPILENRDPLDTRLDPDLGLDAPAPDGAAQGEASPRAGSSASDDNEVLLFLGEAKRIGRNFQQIAAMSDWERSQAAYRSQHDGGSKYHKDQYKNRSKYFKPKTRSAVRKNLTATAHALFASRDVMVAEAENDSDQKQVANAALIKELIDARFNSKAMKTGVPWLETALGARMDTQIMGECCSKQSWTYKTRDRKVKVQKETPFLINGQQAMHPDTGEPLTQITEEEQTVKDVLVDRPEITLIPAENVILDPGTSWINPAQNSPTLIIIWPMQIDAVKDMMREEKGFTPWRKVSDDGLRAAFYSDKDTQALKAAREGAGAAAGARKQMPSFGGYRDEIVEVWECFYRREGIDYQCWTLKDTSLLSTPTPVEEVYPAHRGIRPIVIGTDTLEPHVLYKEAHVESWSSSQAEINDFTNLRMDATRQSVFPTAKVKAGKNIDYKAVQRRDGQGVILVREQDDVMWDRPPGPPANVQLEVNMLSNDFDETAGIFSQGSVQANRQLNETVGGMQIMTSNANATSEFDLLCFIATWVEPVLSQIVYLEQYYEDDETLIAVAGNKAKLFQKFGVDTVTDELLESQIAIGIDVRLGSADPMQRLVKFKTSMDIAMPVLSMGIKEGKVKLKYDDILNEIFGQAGYRNGADRFVEFDEKGGGGPGPEQIQAIMEQMKQLQGENQQLQGKLQDKSQSIAITAQNAQQKNELEHAGRMQELAMQDKTKRTELLFNLLQATETARVQAGQTADAAMLDQRVQLILGLLGHSVQHVQNTAQMQQDGQLEQQRIDQQAELAKAAQSAQTVAPAPQGAQA